MPNISFGQKEPGFKKRVMNREVCGSAIYAITAYAIRESRNASSNMASDSGATNTSIALTVLASCDIRFEPKTTTCSQ